MKQIILGKSVHSALWGTESWEISAFPVDPSVIVAGPGAGKTLSEVFPGFPLLFKVIDAKTRLSVQVHPNETTCRVTGGNPKSEMWCVLSDGPIYAGLKSGTTAAEIEAAVTSGRFEELMVRHEAKAGDVFYIPGGLVHAIGDGVRLYEVQQSSNTTFRLYDWGRIGANGRPRELHVAHALQAIDYSLPPPVACRSLDTPYFRFSQLTGGSAGPLSVGEGEFLALFTARGGIALDGESVAEGTSVLVPSGVSLDFSAPSDSVVLMTRFGGC